MFLSYRTANNLGPVARINTDRILESSENAPILFSLIDDSSLSSNKGLREFLLKIAPDIDLGSFEDDQVKIRDFEFIWMDNSGNQVDTVFQAFPLHSWIYYQNAIECFNYVSGNGSQVLFLVISTRFAEVLFNLLKAGEYASLYVYVFDIDTGINNHPTWVKRFSSNIRGLYNNMEGLIKQLAADTIKFYTEVADLAVSMGTTFHTMAANCYYKSAELLHIYSNDGELQSLMFSKCLVSISS